MYYHECGFISSIEACLSQEYDFQITNHNYVMADFIAQTINGTSKLLPRYKGCYDIAKELNKNGVLCPAMYKRSRSVMREWNSPNTEMVWNDSAIGRILNDERYTGIMIGGKQKRKSVGSYLLQRVPKEKWISVPDMHEAIIPPEIFKQVHMDDASQPHYDSFRRSTCGLLYCAGCRHVLHFMGRTKRRFFCKYTRFAENPNCFQGSLYEDEIVELIAEAIRKQIVVMSRLQGKSVKRKSANVVEKKIKDIKRRIERLTIERFDWYKKFRMGLLTQEEFQEKRDLVNAEIERLEKDVPILENQLQLQRVENETTAEYIQFENFQTLTDEIIHALIERIYVYDEKRIEIIWKHRNMLINN